MDVDEKNEVFEGVLDGYPSKIVPDNDLPDDCFRFHNKYGLFAMMSGYEEQAREILKDGGYPLTGKELWEMRNGLKKQIRDILEMFIWFERVRWEVEKNDAKMSAYFMAHAIHSAMKARIRPEEADIYRGKKTIRGASKGGKAKKQISDSRHEIWKSDARKIWSDKPSYTAWRVAGMLADQYAGKQKLSAEQDTIYRIIKN
jgi:hypothetical protein